MPVAEHALSMVCGCRMGSQFHSLEALVPERGLEPPRPCDHCDLNAARLPVPPLGHECEKASSSVAGAACNEACSFCPAGLPLSTRCQNLHGSVRANHASPLTLPARRSCQRVKVRPVSKLL